MKKIKAIAVTLLLIGLANMPILHQNLPAYGNQAAYKCYFSLVDAVESDIDEHQLNTPYFIYTSVKDLF